MTRPGLASRLPEDGRAVRAASCSAFRVPRRSPSQRGRSRPHRRRRDFAPNAFIRISRQNVVTILVNKAGDGPGASPRPLPMLIAEELEVDLDEVRVVAAPVDAAYAHPQFGMQFTGGSMSIASEWDRLRRAGRPRARCS